MPKRIHCSSPLSPNHVVHGKAHSFTQHVYAPHRQTLFSCKSPPCFHESLLWREVRKYKYNVQIGPILSPYSSSSSLLPPTGDLFSIVRSNSSSSNRQFVFKGINGGKKWILNLDSTRLSAAESSLSSLSSSSISYLSQKNIASLSPKSTRGRPKRSSFTSLWRANAKWSTSFLEMLLLWSLCPGVVLEYGREERERETMCLSLAAIVCYSFLLHTMHPPTTLPLRTVYGR